MTTTLKDGVSLEGKSFLGPHVEPFGDLVEVKGLWIPRHFLNVEPDKFDKIETFQARPEDIWLCSYPRSGTSWLQHIVYLLVKGENDKLTKDLRADKRCPYIDGPVPVIDALKDVPDPRLIMTHLTVETLPKSVMLNKVKVIYIARNVKDVSVSMYHFYKLVGALDFKGTFTDFYQHFIQGKVFYSKWWDHVIAYWKQKDAENVLFLKYEDLYKDLHSGIRKIADFLGIQKTEAEIQRIAELTYFGNMKDNPQVNRSWRVKQGAFKEDEETTFFRKGKVGDWKHYYTEEMSQEVDAICEETIKPVGLEFEGDAFSK